MTPNRSRTRLSLFVVLLLAVACARPTAPPSTPIPSLPSSSSAIARLAPSQSAVPATAFPTATLSTAPTGTPKPPATATAMPNRTPAATSTITPGLHSARPVDLDGNGIHEIVADTLPDDLRPYFGPEPAPAMPYRVFRWNGTEYAEDK